MLTRLVICIATALALAKGSIAEESAPKTVAFLGDSISTGAFAHQSQNWSLTSLGKLLLSAGPTLSREDYAEDFRAAVGEIKAPRRVWHSFAHSIGGALDAEEYSWGYLLGRKQGVLAKNIFITAEKGAHSNNSQHQVDFLLGPKRKLPDDTYIFFTGNDLCSFDPEEGKPIHVNGEEERGHFRGNLLAAADKLIARAAEGNAEVKKVYLMKFLPISDLLTKKEILEKEVDAYGQKLSCEKMRSIPSEKIPALAAEDGVGKTALTLLQALKSAGILKTPEKELNNIPSITAVCRGLLTTKPSDRDRLAAIEKIIQEYNRAIEEAVDEANQRARKIKKGVEFVLLSSPQDFVVEADDIAQDCFHLSLRGQEKLARLVQKELDSR